MVVAEQIAARLFEMQAVTAFRVGNGASEDRGVARFENADRTIRNRSGFRIENTAPDNEAFLGKQGTYKQVRRKQRVSRFIIESVIVSNKGVIHSNKTIFYD